MITDTRHTRHAHQDQTGSMSEFPNQHAKQSRGGTAIGDHVHQSPESAALIEISCGHAVEEVAHEGGYVQEGGGAKERGMTDHEEEAREGEKDAEVAD